MESDSDENEDQPAGMMSLLQRFKPADNKSQRVPATSSSTAVPKNTKPSAKARNAKAPPARERSRSLRRMTARVDDKPGLDGEETGLSEADMEVVRNFTERLEGLRKVHPPVSESAFRTYISDIVSKLQGIVADVKVKKRSVARRARKSDDPLSQALADIDDEASSDMRLMKSRWPDSITSS